MPRRRSFFVAQASACASRVRSDPSGTRFSSSYECILEIINRPRPIFSKEAAKGSIGEQLAAGLAAWTIVCFVRGVANALHFGSAYWTRLFVLTMYGHAFTEGRHLFRESIASFVAQHLRPVLQRLARRIVESPNFVRLQPLRQRNRRKFRVMQN